MSTLQRMQVLLEREQHKTLREMSRRTGRSVSDLVRQFVREFLAQKDREARKA